MSFKRTIIQTIPIPSLPGWESQMILLEFPPGSSAPAHIHPQSGITFIVSGKMISLYEGQEVKEFSAGDSFIDPANTVHHRCENSSADEWLRAVVTYVVEKGQPSSIMV